MVKTPPKKVFWGCFGGLRPSSPELLGPLGVDWRSPFPTQRRARMPQAVALVDLSGRRSWRIFEKLVRNERPGSTIAMWRIDGFWWICLMFYSGVFSIIYFVPPCYGLDFPTWRWSNPKRTWHCGSAWTTAAERMQHGQCNSGRTWELQQFYEASHFFWT